MNWFYSQAVSGILSEHQDSPAHFVIPTTVSYYVLDVMRHSFEKENCLLRLAKFLLSDRLHSIPRALYLLFLVLCNVNANTIKGLNAIPLFKLPYNCRSLWVFPSYYTPPFHISRVDIPLSFFLNCSWFWAARPLSSDVTKLSASHLQTVPSKYIADQFQKLPLP